MTRAHFKKAPQAPPLFTATPHAIIEEAKRLVEHSHKVQDEIVKNVQPETATFANTLLLLALEENERQKSGHLLRIYQHTSPDADVRAASSEAEGLLEDLVIEINMREDLCKLIAAVVAKAEPLDVQSSQLLEKQHKNYLRAGLGLPVGPQRDRFKQTKKRLSQLKVEFGKNLNEENGGIWMSRSELDGVPQDIIDVLDKGQGEHADLLRVAFKSPHVGEILTYATSGDARRRLYLANSVKLVHNIPLLKEALVLRDESARMLGYSNHAAFRLDEKMIKSPATVNSFLDDLKLRLTVRGLEEKEKLKQLKKSDVESRSEEFDGHYFIWDDSYYPRLQLERDYSFDEQKAADYFPLSTVIKRNLETFEKLFGLVFIELTGKSADEASETGNGSDIIWHPDVQLFSTWDEESGEFLGYLYLDLYARPGKYDHNADWNIQPGFIDESGKRSYPSTALLCKFPKPTVKKPTLLKHDEVYTVFHELGHGIHDLVGKTKYARYHGTMCVQDFCEAPSQLLENWCWNPQQLKVLSQHYSYLSPEYLESWQSENVETRSQPSEKIPDDIIANLVRTKKLNNGMWYLHQLKVAIFDMTVHQAETAEAAAELNPSFLWNSLTKEIMMLDGPEILGMGYDWGHGQVNFPHFMGDYDAGYYGYLCSSVYSLDIFYTFFKADLVNASEGRRFRRMILEKGGSEDEAKMLAKYLGREPSSDAFYQELSLQ